MKNMFFFLRPVKFLTLQKPFVMSKGVKNEDQNTVIAIAGYCIPYRNRQQCRKACWDILGDETIHFNIERPITSLAARRAPVF